MRHDVFYEYDLPVELLDDVSPTEEVLEVFFARTDDQNQIPILFTRERIVWAYPEVATVYRVFALQYIDIVGVSARYMPPAVPSLSFTTVNGQTYQFRHLQDSKEDMRGRLMTLCGMLKARTGGNWRIWNKKRLFIDEYIVDTKDHRDAEEVAGVTLTEPEKPPEGDDVFEDKPMPGKGCFESNEALFSHFPGAADVFEESDDGTGAAAEDPYAGADAKVARIVEEVTAEAEQSVKEKPAEKQPAPAVDDTVVYESSSGKKDEQQWASSTQLSGDAQILSSRPRTLMQSIRDMQNGIGEDDSIIYGEPRKPVQKTERRDPDPPMRLTTMYSKEDDDSIIYPTGNEEPVIITPMVKPKPEFEPIDVDEEAVVAAPLPRPAYEIGDEVGAAPYQEPADPYQKATNLQPRDGFDTAAIDKLLEELKHLWESGVITEDEYKERCLKLFKQD